jgi:hypothetical protein
VVRAGEVVADRAGADVHDDGCAGILEHVPGRFEQGVVEPELTHLRVQLEHLDPGLDQRLHLLPHAVLGIERRRPQALRHLGRERRGPVVQVRRDPGPVGVGQCTEPAYAEAAELLDPLLVRPAVADRPRPADLGAGLVELAPDRGLDVRRQEVDVHVEQTGQPEVAPEGRDRGLGVQVAQKVASQPCAAAMSTRW